MKDCFLLIYLLCVSKMKQKRELFKNKWVQDIDGEETIFFSVKNIYVND